MIKTTNFTDLENINLTKEISLVAPQDCPLTTIIMGKGYDTTGSKIVTWREKTLDNTEDISQVEGSTTDTFQSSARAEKSNVCEIFKKATSISGTADASSITGVSDLFAEEINDRLIEMKVNIEKKLINGTKDDGSASPYVRKMDGLLAFALPENIVKSPAITEPKIKETVKKLWDAGMSSGTYIAMVNADLKEDIDALYANKYSYIAQESLFGLIVSSIQTNYGTIKLVLNRHMPTDKMVVFDPAFVKISYLRQPHFELLAKTGDSINGHVIGEMTLKMLNQKAIAVFEIDVVAPTLSGATIDDTNKVVTLSFSEPIENACKDIATLKTKVTLASDGTTFGALASGDKVAITNGKLVVTFASALSTATNQIKVGADAVADSAGNKNAEFTTDAIDASA